MWYFSVLGSLKPKLRIRSNKMTLIDGRIKSLVKPGLKSQQHENGQIKIKWNKTRHGLFMTISFPAFTNCLDPIRICVDFDLDKK